MRTALRHGIMVGLLGAGVGIWGCGNGDGGTAPPPTGDAVVHMTAGLQFSPASVTVQAGETVEWVNDVTMFHTITPDGHTEWVQGAVTNAGDTFTHTFETPGTYEYYCDPHLTDGMTGVVVVQ